VFSRPESYDSSPKCESMTSLQDDCKFELPGKEESCPEGDLPIIPFCVKYALCVSAEFVVKEISPLRKERSTLLIYVFSSSVSPLYDSPKAFFFL